MTYNITLRHAHFTFPDLKTLMAKATPLRSGDVLAGVAAANAQERVAAQMCLSEVPLSRFLEEHLIAPENDEVTQLILSTHDDIAFATLKNFSVGEFRNWLLSYDTTTEKLASVARGITPEMAAAVSKIMGNQDLILAARKCRVVSRFRDTIGLEGRMSARLQPNHPTDDARGVAASILDGLLMGSGDAVIGINPVSDSVHAIESLIHLVDEIIQGYEIPTQSCLLAHVTTQIKAIERGVPVDLVFQSIAGTQAANASFGFTLRVLDEARQAAQSLNRGTVGDNVMYFETGQGSCLSANAHFGIDQQTCEARAYAISRHFEPLLHNTVVGFIGPEYLYDGKQIIRAGLEDNFCGKLLGVPMGVDVCYTNHAEADQDDMDTLLTLLGVAGCNFVMGIPGADDIMLGYQTTSFHDMQYLRQVLGVKPAPEFEAWLHKMNVVDERDHIRPLADVVKRFTTSAPNATKALLSSSENTNANIEDTNRENTNIEYSMSQWEAQRSVIALRAEWKKWTVARVAQERAGASLATSERLDFQLAHANARDAVHWPFDRETLCDELEKSGTQTLGLNSDAPDRAAYLQRPDWGQRLAPRSRDELETWSRAHENYDVSVCVCDGLSALAVERHAVALWSELAPLLELRGWRVAPICVVKDGRVALQDEIGAVLKTPLSLMLIGERPGLAMPDSLGAYLVFDPQVGNTDANRNCISNIRPEGLPLKQAAQKIDYLMGEAHARRISGVELKDESLLLMA